GSDLTQCPHCGARPLVRLPLPLLSPPTACPWSPHVLTRHNPPWEDAVRLRERCHMVLTDPGDSCVPWPPRTLAPRLGRLTCPAPEARPWGSCAVLPPPGRPST